MGLRAREMGYRMRTMPMLWEYKANFAHPFSDKFVPVQLRLLAGLASGMSCKELAREMGGFLG